MKFLRKSKTSAHGDSARRRATRSALVLGALLLPLFGPGWALAQEAGMEGRLVTQVRVVYESGQIARERIPPLPLQVGSSFQFIEERESLRTLYRMGDYSDIRVTAVTASEGLEVNFIVTPNLYNNVITVEGLKPPPSEAGALASLRLVLGEPFRESALSSGVNRL